MSRCKAGADSDRQREGEAREDLYKPAENPHKGTSRRGQDRPEINSGRCTKHQGYMRRRRPPHPKEGKTGDHQYPRVNPPPQRQTAVANPKAREIAVTRRSGPEHAEVPPMKERPAVGGRKPPRTSPGRTRGFQSPGSQTNRGPIEDPRTSELDHGTTSGRAMNDMIERQACPIATAGRRTGHGSDKGAQTQDEAFKAALKWLILHPKQKDTAEPPPWMQKQPQLPYTMTAPSNYRRK